MDKLLSEYGNRLPSRLIEDIRANMQGINHAKLKKVLEIVAQEYENAKISPG